MTANQERAFNIITEQQKSHKEYTPQWMVGEQLKDICTREPDKAELIAQDLTVPEMSLVHAEKKIKAWADKHKSGGGACVPPNIAEGILREFYGLGKPGERVSTSGSVSLSLEDYL